MSRTALTIAGAAAALLAAGAARLFLGGPSFAWPESHDFLLPRLLHVASAATVGAALGVAGVLLQSLLRNPLASPDLLGVSAGSSLAVLLGAYLAWLGGSPGVGGAWASGTAALIGAAGTLVLVYALAQRRGAVDPVSMILIGVIVSVLFGAISTVVQQLMPPDPARRSVRWLFGYIDEDASWLSIGFVAALTALGTAASSWLGPAMDAAAMSEDEARAVGVRVARLRGAQFLIAGALTAGSVVLAGPIGFVGLVCPHLVRLCAGPRHRALAIGSGLAGAAMVTGADALVAAASLASGAIGRLPIGVLTALIGGPVFIAALRREGRRVAS